MKKPFQFLNRSVLCVLAGMLAATSVQSAEFPDSPLTLVTWSKAGGGGDVLGRHLQGPLSKAAGVPVVIVNKPGGSGAVAMEYALKMKPDGHHLLIVTTSGILSAHVAGTRLSPADFKAVIRIQKDPTIVMVKAGSPFKTLRDALNAAKKKPGSVKFAGGFTGTLESLLCYQLFKAEGLPYSYVPFTGGGGEAMTALLGGHVDVLFGNPSEVSPQVEAGQIVVIGVAMRERMENYPQVPMLKEQGMDYEATLWRGIVAPPKTPDDKVSKLNELIKKAMQDPAFKEYTKKSGLLDGYLTAKEFDATIKREYEQYGKIVKEMGVKPKKKK